MASLNEYLLFYRDRFLSNFGDVNFVKRAVEKLNTIEVTADAITKTGIYKVVRHLAKTSGPWIDIVTPLYSKWRSLLLAKQNNSSKPAETEVPSRSQNDVSKNLCSERVKSSATLHTGESPKNFANKPVVTNGANYPIKSSDVQENIYFQNKGVRLSEKQTNQTIKLSDDPRFLKLPDLGRNDPTSYGMKSSENHASKFVVIDNDLGELSHFGGKVSTWNRGKRPPENHTNKGMEVSNDAKYPQQFGVDEEFFAEWNRRMNSPENLLSNLPKNEGDKPAYFTNEEKSISKLENGSFGMINGFHHSLPNSNQGFGRAENYLKIADKMHSSANNFHPSVNNLFSAHNKNIQNNFEQIQNNLDSSTSLNAYTSINALSPRSSNSQNPADTAVVWTASPNKTGKLPNPYEIDMKEGMFRVVKSDEDVPPAIARVRQMYNHDDLRDSWDYAPKKIKNKPEEKVKTPIKEQSVSKNIKSSKVTSGKKSLEKKSHSAKSKNSVEKLKSNLRTNSENTTCKPEKRKLTLTSESAIQKSQCEKVKEASGLPKTESCNNSTSPKFSRKEDPLTKLINSSGCKESQTVSPEKYGNTHKSSINEHSTKLINSSNSKEGQTAKSDCKRNSPIVRHVDYAPISDNKNTSSHKTTCDKVLNKGLTSEAAEKFMSSKKERTSVYSGKKPVQEIPKLRILCIQMLKKNIESIKHTFPVPYEQLKPVLTHFTASRLKKIEDNNPYLLQGSDELWKSFCRKKFREVKPVPPETWREIYWRTREDQDKKLKDITANISASMSKSGPERQIKIAVIESPKPAHKRMRLSEPKTEVNSVKASSSKEALNHKNSFKESISSHTKTSKDSSSHKKSKKATAPLMSKVKKTLGKLAMHKK